MTEAARRAAEEIALKILSYMDRHGDVLDYPDGIARIVATAIAQARAAERAAAEKYYDQMARDFVQDYYVVAEKAKEHCEALRAIPYDEFYAEECCANVEAALGRIRRAPTGGHDAGCEVTLGTGLGCSCTGGRDEQ